MGSAPASGAVGRALATHCCAWYSQTIRAFRRAPVRREGAPNGSRGGCAPPSESPAYSDRDFNRPFGTGTFGRSFPALKRRAIFNCPSGTRAHRDGAVGQASCLSRTAWRWAMSVDMPKCCADRNRWGARRSACVERMVQSSHRFREATDGFLKEALIQPRMNTNPHE